MNSLNEVQDIHLSIYLSFEKEENEKEKIGSNSKDFEIIQKVGKGASGKVFKVISKLNNKVYAMKIADLAKLKKKGEKALKRALKE